MPDFFFNDSVIFAKVLINTVHLSSIQLYATYSEYKKGNFKDMAS